MKLIQFYQNILIAAPQNSPGGTHPQLQLFHSILSKLVQDLKKALKTKEVAKLVPILEDGIKKLDEILPKIKNKDHSGMITTIMRGAAELAQQLPAYPNGGIKEVNAFIKYSLGDILYLSLKGIEKPGNYYLQIRTICVRMRMLRCKRY